MIKLTDYLWIGNGADGNNYRAVRIGAVLNVAQDLRGTTGWPEVEYAQVGLIDGPGNEVADYCAVVFTLKALVRRHDRVLVCDHDGGRAVVVALMYLNLIGGERRDHWMAWSHWPTWDERLAEVCEGLDVDLPTPHPVHVAAFNRIPWGLIEVL